jgi:hypothetical protein
MRSYSQYRQAGKRKVLKYVLGLLCVSTSVMAQAVSEDSIKALQAQKEMIKTNEKVNEYKTELAKLENSLAEKTKEVGEKAKKSQASADKNNEVATRLSADAQNKGLANDARKASREAQRDAKDARKSEDDLEKIKKDIISLQAKIADGEAGLAKAGGTIGQNGTQLVTVDNAARSTSNNSAAVPGQARGAAFDSVKSAASVTTPGNQPMPVPNGGTVQQNYAAIPVGDAGTTSELAEKIVAVTAKNYPQQSGQPTIIINNIIATPNYPNPQTPPATAFQAAGMHPDDQREYEEFRAWQRMKNARSTYPEPAKASPAQPRPDMMPTQQNYADAPARNQYTFQERFGERPVRNSGLWVIPMVGIHASNFKADFDKETADGRSGWNAGLDFRIRAKRFFVQPGVHYLNSSVRFTSNDSISNAPLLSGPRIHSLKAPLLIGVYLTKANRGFFKVNIKGGAVANYVLAVDKNEQNKFTKNNIEEFSYGLNAGLGLEFGLITIDLSHEWGMSRYFKDNNDKNNVLRATLGIKL